MMKDKYNFLETRYLGYANTTYSAVEIVEVKVVVRSFKLNLIIVLSN